ncbi:MAG: hypothetical protein K2N46_02880 [Lachnospiraceae bacterium]|nr:hypothetical protein [Lachnospiraceae bacterium]
MNRTCSLLLILFCALLFQSMPVQAAEIGGETYLQQTTPFMLYIRDTSCTIMVNSNGEATVSAFVKGVSSVTRASVTANLQQLKNGKWTTIKTFSKTVNSNNVNLLETYSVEKGYSYRVQITVIVYCNETSEKKTVISETEQY